MSLLPVDSEPVKGSAWLQLGFRPFFTGAAVFAVVSIVVWTGVYFQGWAVVPATLSTSIWHAHEMVFGYALAVIAGFLLTAVKNWTGVQTIRGGGLLVLFLLWLGARLSMLLGQDVPVTVAAVLDCLFLLGLCVAISIPLIKVRQWKQFGIVSKIILMWFCNIAFYLGVYWSESVLMSQAVYFGLYMVLALIFVMARRVVPSFIQNGVGYPLSLKNPLWLDVASLVLFVAFVVVDVFALSAPFAAVLAVLLVLLHLLRLYNWYTPGIWKKPLLWVLYLAYAFLSVGFVLIVLSVWLGLSKYLAMHAFALGGIGLITLGMMARVTIGHTGRNVFEPPSGLGLIFLFMLLAAVVRTLLPIFAPQYYSHWIILSQALWVLAFLLFLVRFVPMLLRARTDGRPG